MSGLHFLKWRKGNYKKGSLAWGIAENLLGPIVIPFYLFFGFLGENYEKNIFDAYFYIITYIIIGWV